MRLLLVEDEFELGRVVRDLFERHGYAVDVAPDLAWAEEAVRYTDYGVVLVDRRLPDGDGKSLVEFANRHGIKTRFLFLSALGALEDKVAGFDAGGDDYIVKPFEPDELIARVRALLRRSVEIESQEWTCGNLTFCTKTRNIAVRGESLALPKRELAVLECLMESAGRVVTRARLEDQVYGFEAIVNSNTLESHVSRIRKILNHKQAGVAIRAVRGVGYMLHDLTT